MPIRTATHSLTVRQLLAIYNILQWANEQHDIPIRTAAHSLTVSAVTSNLQYFTANKQTAQ